MSIKATITKHFHRDVIVMRAGDVVKETMTFVDFDHANRFSADINRNHAHVDYHIANITIDEKNFICYDLSKIDEIYPDLEWRELA